MNWNFIIYEYRKNKKKIMITSEIELYIRMVYGVYLT